MQNTLNPFVLIVLDGWGHREGGQYNAIAQTHTPCWDQLWKNYPHLLIEGSGHSVGLPEGQMGNSEVGHLTIGAGRVVYQELTRIDKAITDGDFFTNPVFCTAMQQARQTHKAVHVLGLLSPGGVHSHERQIHALLKLAQQQGVQKLYLHAFLDGRDTPPQSALASLQALSAFPHCQIASLCGRYYAMDRDKRWERTQQAYDLLTLGKADYHAANAIEGLEMAYARGETDEFVKPITIGTNPVTVNDGDVIIFMNFRADRARQLTRAFTDANFDAFPRTRIPQLAAFVSLTQYAADIATQIAFPPQSLANVLSEYLAKLNLRQFHIAETEKYAHVTFFFNGGREEPFAGETRLLIPSPKVATYDLQPEMSALQLTDELVKAIRSREYAFIVCNYANADMVGHTGNFAAAVKAVETLDSCLEKVVQALQEVNGEALITADHGNIECMYDEQTRQPHTAHTSDPVPLIYIGRPARFIRTEGSLSDIAPTLLYLMGLQQPVEMTGKNLLKILI